MGLSNSIREHRFKFGEMTQKELAGQVGVSRQTMNAIENNKHAPTIDVAIRIADVFREAVDTVFEYEYDGKPEFRDTTARRAVVTRYSEPASTCSLAGFCKFSMSDAESDACSFLDANESPCTRPDACGL